MEETRKLRNIVIGTGEMLEFFCSCLEEAGLTNIERIDISKNEWLRDPASWLRERDFFNKLAAQKEDCAIYCPLPDNEERTHILSYARYVRLKTPSYRHPSAIIDSTAKIHDGVYIFERVKIAPYVEIGPFSIVSADVNIAPCANFAMEVFLGVGANIGVAVVVGETTHIGAGATIAARKILGRYCKICDGAAVTKDVPDGGTVVADHVRDSKEDDLIPWWWGGTAYL